MVYWKHEATWHLSEKVPTFLKNCRSSASNTSGNAEEECLFSIVRKNKTESCSALELDGTKSSILDMKCAYPESTTPCYKWIPDGELLTSFKKAIATYNKGHSK